MRVDLTALEIGALLGAVRAGESEFVGAVQGSPDLDARARSIRVAALLRGKAKLERAC